MEAATDDEAALTVPGPGRACCNDAVSPRAWLLILLCPLAAAAGEISGVPQALPPYLDPVLDLTFSNDFLGRGGSVDDFRTQQLILTAWSESGWLLSLDHSVLTLSESPGPARTDQVAASLGYRAIASRSETRSNSLVLGVGLRSTGDYAGERMQNGFHRLIGSNVDALPYTDGGGTSATAWIGADHYRVLRSSAGKRWRWGFWAHGDMLVAGNGELDATAAILAVANTATLDTWFGLRRDWRSGYDDLVLRQAADAEDDLAFTLGLRFGALVLETVQQFGGDGSFGQLRLVSMQKSVAPPDRGAARGGVEFGFLLPDVQVHVAGRLRSSLLASRDGAWRESIFVSADFGEPQHEQNDSVFVRSWQLGTGLEWERRLGDAHPFISGFGSVGLGWRNEMLLGDGSLAGSRSSSVSRPALLATAGLRVDASRFGAASSLRIQLAVSGVLPASDANLQIGSTSLPVMRPSLNLLLGVSLEFG